MDPSCKNNGAEGKITQNAYLRKPKLFLQSMPQLERCYLSLTSPTKVCKSGK